MTEIWIRSAPIVLASTSATRRMLLTSAGLPVECRVPGVDERAVEAQFVASSPSELARRLAEAKAFAVSVNCDGRLVIGADQVLSCEGVGFHKPRNLPEAQEQIARLSGRTHSLHVAVALAEDGRIIDSFVDEARLTMRNLDAEAIGRYVEAAGIEHVTASVGGYQLEGLGIHLFSRIEGEHSTILGLPLLPLLDRLRARHCLAF